MSPATAKKKKQKADAAPVDAGVDVEILDLFPEAVPAKAGTTEEIVHLNLDEIEPDPDNRDVAEPDPELIASIKRVGVLTPITVVPNPDPEKVKAGKPYRIRDGERRYRASIATGWPTIRSIIALADITDTRGQKLLKQWQANWHKKLDPMFEARLIKQVQSETGLSVAALAKISGKPKSTIADRLALAEVPAPFHELFDKGHLTAAAAPIVKKYAHLPIELLTEAVAAAREDYEWSEAIDDGVAIELWSVETTLREEIERQRLREIPEALVLHYTGERVKIGKLEYALNVDEFDTIRAAHEKDVKKAAGTTRTKASPSDKKWAQQQQRATEARKREEEKQARYKKAKPAILTAIAEKVKAMPATATGKLADLVIRGVKGYGGLPKEYLKRGSSAEDLLRYAAMIEMASVSEYSLITDLQRYGKLVGVDVSKIVDTQAPKVKAAKVKAAKVKAAKVKAAKVAPAKTTKKKAKR